LEAQKTMNNQCNTEQKEQRWRFHNTWLQTILQSHSNKKKALYWHKIRHEEKCSKIENPDRNPHSYTHLIFYQGSKNIQWRKQQCLQ
jgi:hypothetical protein